MTATNHALTGATIGLLIGNPIIALPAAVLSHFLCDAVPHYGSSKEDDIYLRTTTFKALLLLDAFLCLAIVGVLTGSRPSHWFLACVCAFLATSPDLFWINRFRKLNAGKKWKSSWFSNFAYRIQWFQKPIGAFVELAWAVAAISILRLIIK